jgi:excisionase family DNA binding protein
MRLVTIKIASEFLMVKESTLYSWVHNGSIPFHKLNGLIRFDMDELETWVKTSKRTVLDVSVIQNRGDVSDIDVIVKKAIDSVKGNRYNPSNGKPGQIQGLRKGV